MELNFKGKTILVTGAGRGIGRAIAIALVRSGCKVYALNRSKPPLDTLVEEYADIIPIIQDLKDWDGTRETIEKLEPLDGLVNNAGDIPYAASALDTSKAMLDFYLQNNLYSAINCTQMVAKKMIATGKRGSIVNVSSIIACAAYPNSLGYSTAKAGMDMATKQFALELGPHRIRVNSVNATLVMTEFAQKAITKSNLPLYELFLERTPIGRLPKVNEVVSPVLYLLSDLSNMVTGTSHVIDGGLLCNITAKL